VVHLYTEIYSVIKSNKLWIHIIIWKHYAQCKKPIPKDYTLCDPIFIIFGKEKIDDECLLGIKVGMTVMRCQRVSWGYRTAVYPDYADG
jgi:hypothetical protein